MPASSSSSRAAAAATWSPPSCSAAARRGLGLRAAGRLRADHHDLDRRGGRRSSSASCPLGWQPWKLAGRVRCCIVAADRCSTCAASGVGPRSWRRSSCSSSSPTRADRRRTCSATGRDAARGRRASARERASSGAWARSGSGRACCCSCCAPTRSAAAPTPASRPSPTACDHARAARAHRQAHHALHGDLARVHRRRAPGRLPAPGRTPRAGKTMNAVLFANAFGEELAGVPRSDCAVRPGHAVRGGRAAVRRGPGRLPRRTARARRTWRVDSWVPHRFAAALRPADDAERRRAHGRRPSLARCSTRGGNVAHAGGHVLDQRLPDLLALDAGRWRATGSSARRRERRWKREIAVQLHRASSLCASILAVTIYREVRRTAAGSPCS